MIDLLHIKSILNHIQNVQRNCYKLGFALIENGDETGLMLIANGQIHDNSKFKGFEFQYLKPSSVLLKEAVTHHASTNPHHPEYLGHISKMPDVYLAEMVCDCAARSQEFETSVRDWFACDAKQKFEFNDNDDVDQKIQLYLNLLLTPAFKN